MPEAAKATQVYSDREWRMFPHAIHGESVLLGLYGLWTIFKSVSSAAHGSFGISRCMPS